MILEQQPMKVAEALLLFLKGEGHFTNISILDISKKRAKAVAYQQDMLGKGFFLGVLLLFRLKDRTVSI